MIADTQILQIVPRAPGGLDGVGDYALTLARSLASRGLQTTFVAAHKDSSTAAEFPVMRMSDPMISGARHVILHYANYGYQPRGVPLRLQKFVRHLRPEIPGRWITVFHELYASGPPWSSAFWLRPFQVNIARAIVDISDHCIVTSSTLAQEIRTYDSSKPVQLLPVMSNFGEPKIDSLRDKSPGRWAICGGTALITRSLRSFPRVYEAISAEFRPVELDIIGGENDAHVRDLLKELGQMIPTLSCSYHPAVGSEKASALLSGAAFAWIDYFGDGKIWPDMILKSGSFAACCAHGVVPIFSHAQTPLSLNNDALPGPFFIADGIAKFPEQESLSFTQEALHRWYHRHASAERVAEAYAAVLK